MYTLLEFAPANTKSTLSKHNNFLSHPSHKSATGNLWLTVIAKKIDLPDRVFFSIFIQEITANKINSLSTKQELMVIKSVTIESLMWCKIFCHKCASPLSFNL